MRSLSTNVLGGFKHIVSIALIVAAAMLLIFGPRAGEETPKGDVVVEYWEKWTGAEQEAMRQIVDDFNSTVGRQKHIYVHYLSTSAIEQKTLVAAAAGVPPDVAGLYNQDIPQFSSMNSLEPLETLAAEHGLTADHYKKVYWDEGHYNGRLYGLVSTGYDAGLFYNKTLFAGAGPALRARGLDPSRAPRTINELDQYADALNRVDSNGHIELAGFLPSEPGWYLNYICIWFGGSWWNDQTHRFTFRRRVE